MTKQTYKDLAKSEILKKVSEYYHLQKDDNKKNFIPYSGRVYDEKELVNLVSCSLDFWLTHGEWANKFEKNLANFLGIKHCLFVNSGSSANLLAFMALTSPLLEERKINRGDEVITIAACFPTTISPIINYGAIPVFVDIDIDTVNININEMKKALSTKTKAVMIAHTLGNPFNVNEVRKFCDENNLWLISDNCDALGSKYDGEYTGTSGDIGTSSFYPPHHIMTGEGGAVYTNNSLLNKIMLSLRDWGRDCICRSGQDNLCGKRFSKKFKNLPEGFDHKYVYSHAGMNLKSTDMQAAIGCAQLEKLNDFIEIRKRNRELLYDGLKDLDNYFIFQNSIMHSDPCWFSFLITLRDEVSFNRNDITKFLEDKGIQTRNLFASNIIKQPFFENLIINHDYKVIGDLKNTDKIMNDSFFIGVYPGLTEDNINYMIDTIKKFIGEK